MKNFKVFNLYLDSIILLPSGFIHIKKTYTYLIKILLFIKIIIYNLMNIVR